MLVHVSSLIRSKPNWIEKVKDAELLAKWKQEIEEQAIEKSRRDRRQNATIPLTDDAWQYLVDELQWLASLADEVGQPSAVDGVWQADRLIPKELKDEFIAGVKKLENVPQALKDYHPDRKNPGRVLDLVHPSLCPLVYGESRRLPEGSRALPALATMGGGEIVPPLFVKKKPNRPYYGWKQRDENPNEDYATSAKYQWLPSEFDVDSNGKVKISSYINNLHPVEHSGLYHTIAKIFEKFVPMFSRCLTDCAGADERRRPFHVPEMSDKQDYRDKYRDYSEPRTLPEGSVEAEPIRIDKFVPRSEGAVPEANLLGKRLQVIVKIASTELTKAKPRMMAGSWHVEGMQNECIVASGIYYFNCENVTESSLAFRESVESPSPHSYDDTHGTEQSYIYHYYGVENGATLAEKLGSLVTQEDRCIVFPNIYQVWHST